MRKKWWYGIHGYVFGMIGLIMMLELLSQVNAELINMGVFEALTIILFIFIIAVAAFSVPCGKN
ncbi:hypothetical protein CW713_04890 [Methanophagales archaeon]|nr:MAG: hypothetical protein CW713_04890 [Methanophagales archaeon]